MHRDEEKNPIKIQWKMPNFWEDQKLKFYSDFYF